MLDILSIQKGDLVTYGSYICSESLRDERYSGIYQSYMHWSPDGRPVELWLTLLNNDGLKRIVRSSQVTKVYRKEGQEA